MRTKGKLLFIVLLLVMVFSFPGVALAHFDSYGYNAEGREFKGTLDNWEAFLNHQPPTSYDPKATDIIFIHRKWDKLFDPMIQGKPPSGAGAWQKAELWEYLSGDQLGYTWHLNMKVVYSPDTPIPGAMVLTPEEMGFTGFYCVDYDEWLEGPHGEKTVLNDLSVKSGVVQKALHF